MQYSELPFCIDFSQINLQYSLHNVISHPRCHCYLMAKISKNAENDIPNHPFHSNKKSPKNYKNHIFMEKYVIDDYQYRALLAMREFAENAFCGYQEGHGQKEEQELANSFSWLVINFIDLVDATKETVDEYVERRQQYQSLRQQ